MSEPVKLWRYYLPSQKGEGFAEIVLCSSGFFAAVSDWGNYSFAWRSFGVRDFRAFVAGLDEGYLESKLGPCSGHQDQVDAEATLKNARQRICEDRRAGELSKEKARAEWEATEEIDDECNAIGVDRWLARTSLDEAWLAVVESPTKDLVAFCRKVMPRLAEVIRAELDAEKGGAR